MGRLFGTHGIRAIVNKALTPTLAYGVGLALAKSLNGKGPVVAAWDTRTSNEMLNHAVSAGLMTGGCNVHHLGLVPTPLLSFATPRLNCTAGVMVTASHNPPEYNGIKLWGKDGAAYTSKADRQIEQLYTQPESDRRVSWKLFGQPRPTEDFRSLYTQELLQQVDCSKIRQQKLFVAADCGGGAASILIPQLLEQAGCRVEAQFCIPDGLFQGRHPEPKEQNLTKLKEHVVKAGADLGMAWDGDADRIIFIDHKGRFIMGDRSFALAAYYWLRDCPDRLKKIVTTVATSDVVRDVAEAINAEVVQTKVGEPNIVAKMKEVDAQIGGEENGGVIFRGWSWAREGLLTALIILDFLAQEETSLNELDKRFPSYSQVKTGLPCTDAEKAPLLERLIEQVASDIECDTLDGLKIRYSDGWVLLRPSGTEPKFRVFAEAKTHARAEELAQQGLKLLQKTREEIKT